MISKRIVMVNTILLLLFILVSSDLISQEKVQKNDFRNSKWGTKKDKVLSTEKNKPLEAEPLDQYFVVIYTGEVAGLKAWYKYSFLNDVLVRGAYAVIKKHTHENEYIDDYSKLKEVLTRKYGSPIKSDIRWYSNLYKKRLQDYGLAVSIGHLAFISEWETDMNAYSLNSKRR